MPATAKPTRQSTTPAATLTPERTPLEQALKSAWSIRPEEVLAAAVAELARATEQVLRLGETSWRTSWPAEYRAALLLEAGAAQKARFLESIGRDTPVRIPSETPDVSAALVHGLVVVKGPSAVTDLLSRCEAMVRDAEGRIVAHRARLGEMSVAFGEGRTTTSGFIWSVTYELGEIDRLATLAHDRRNAMAGVLGRLAASAPGSLGDRVDLVLGIAEAGAMTRQQDVRLGEMIAELAQIQGDLGRLGTDGGEPGRIAAELDRRQREVGAKIEARKTELAHVAATSRGDLVDRAVRGETAALAELHGIARTWPGAFEPGLCERITEVMADALSADAAVWAELIS